MSASQFFSIISRNNSDTLPEFVAKLNITVLGKCFTQQILTNCELLLIISINTNVKSKRHLWEFDKRKKGSIRQEIFKKKSVKFAFLGHLLQSYTEWQAVLQLPQGSLVYQIGHSKLINVWKVSD